jgi:hypothetical protein
MPVNVNEIVSNVVPEPESTDSQSGGPEPDWKQAERTREMDTRLFRDRWRTAAEAFDD